MGCDAELKERKKNGTFVGKFAKNCHFYGYEARLATPSKFDACLAYATGHLVCNLVEQGYTGMMATVSNLTAPVADWVCGAVPLTSLMKTNVVAGRLVPMVKPSEVTLESYPFKAFAAHRHVWAVEDAYRKPAGPIGNDRTVTLYLESLERKHTASTLLPHEREAELRALVRELVLDQSEFVTQRLAWQPELPPILRGVFKFVETDLPQTASPEEIPTLKGLFPVLFEHSAARLKLVPNSNDEGMATGRTLRIGVVLSGGPAPGGHNVIAGLFDFLKGRNIDSKLYGFRDGPAGLVACDYVEVTEELIRPYRNQGGFNVIGTSRVKIESPAQMKASADSCNFLQLNGLVICGGDDSNTNAALLADYFLREGVKTAVVGVPKTIDADLRNDDVEMSFGFDTTSKLFGQMLANICFDCSASHCVYHFVRLMGRSASHITLEVALQCGPNYCAISEEVKEKNQTMMQIVSDVTDIVVERFKRGKNHGVIIIPEGLVEFTCDVASLIGEINEVLAAKKLEDPTNVREFLSEVNKKMFDMLPEWLRLQLLGERDPHGNVRVSLIESERLVAALVEAELRKRPEYKAHFRYQCSFLGYQGRCGLVSNFDCTYCYALGFLVGALVDAEKTGYIAAIKNLISIPEDWELGAIPLTSMMNIERRKGKDVPVIQKKLVDLQGAPFKTFAAKRSEWAFADAYPRKDEVACRFHPTCDSINVTLILERGGQPAHKRLRLHN
eukprot:NODE_55_length_2386_cov_96.646983_g41_i0.p2 GENE.NODE_55_length_2386_cov_96.646983_g41_i0~~NODE_55_length_2386_cov_96.646983_g41_i0.p2  ORF type:complete len:736 (+),score=340.37 NODE_55_length_2386_cov_96.646983_g41_i0:23-2209(+)